MSPALIAFLITFGITALCSSPFWGQKLWRKVKKKVVRPSEHIGLIISLLDNLPEEWVSDKYYLTHSGLGICMWIANDDYGLSVDKDGKRSGPSIGSASERLSETDRAFLWQAVLRWKEYMGTIDARDFAEKIRKHYQDRRQ